MCHYVLGYIIIYRPPNCPCLLPWCEFPIIWCIKGPKILEEKKRILVELVSLFLLFLLEGSATWVFRFYPLPPHFPPTCPTCQLSRAALKFPFQDYTLNYLQQIPKSQSPSTNLKTATSKFSIWYLHIDIWIMVNIFEDSRITILIGLHKLRMIYSLLRPPFLWPSPSTV